MTEKIVGSLDVGAPSSFLSEKHTLCFTFHNFACLEDKEFVTSKLKCHGLNWGVKLYPFGCVEAKQEANKGTRATYEPVSLFLTCETRGVGRAKYTFRSKNCSMNINCNTAASCGTYCFTTRAKLLSNGLDQNGAFRIFVDIQLILKQPEIYKAPQQLSTKMGHLLQSHYGSDVEFLVQDTKFHAHKAILSVLCPALMDLVAEHSNHHGPIEIVQANEYLFGMLLEFVYTEQVPVHFDWYEQGMELLTLADRLGCTDLKLFAEAKVVELGVDPEEAPTHLLFAQSHSCALLKEASLEALTVNPMESIESEGWNRLKESGDLLTEVMKHSLTRASPNYKTVTELRHELIAAGSHDIDGSKEMLVERLRGLPVVGMFDNQDGDY